MKELRRALIIGSGSIGRRHAENIRQLHPKMQFALLRRTNTESSLVSDLDAVVFLNTDDAMKWQPDFAVIASPSSQHYFDISALRGAKVPFYIEKPVVTSRSELDAIINEDPDFGAVTLSGCNLRFLPSLQLLKKLIDSGKIGRVVRANFVAGQWLPSWRPNQDYRQSYSANPKLGGGVVLDLVHEFDAARFLLGEFGGLVAMKGKLSSLEIESEDVASIILRGTHSDVLASISLDYISRKPVRRYELVGEEGTLIWDLSLKTLHLQQEGHEESIDCGEDGFDVNLTYITAIKEFMMSVANGTKTSQDVFDGLRSAELAIRAKEV